MNRSIQFKTMEIMDQQQDIIKSLKQGQKMAFIATGVTIVLAVMKAVVGYTFDSKLLVADAFHSGADVLAIFASGFGLWLASRKKSARFPYGLYKAETMVSLIIGGLIVWAGIKILLDGYHKLIELAPVHEFPLLPIGASLISIVAAYFIARKEKSVGSLINSQSLLVNARESFLDIITSGVVLVGILLAYARIPYIEGAIIILISLLVLKLGVETIRSSFLILMDANLDPELVSEIEEKIDQIYGVKGVGEVKIRQSGPFKMVECTILTDPSLPLFRSHELADKIEDFIRENYAYIESVFIHVEPLQQKVVSAIIPVKDVNLLDSTVFDHFGRAPFYIIVKIHDDRTEIEDFYYNEFLGEDKHIGLKVIKTVISYKLDILFTPEIGEISFYMLKENFVDIYQVTDGLKVSEVIDKYRRQQLKKIVSPTHTIETSQV
ncbi:MAG: cation diffusion facilitator family transporter [Candidatus Auribacterota bacterium]|nr:cation diffusion facilitator family transporter [Candidatus Auribacterota bacterium]